MTKRKRVKSIKEQLNIATKKGRDEGFKAGQQYANKLRDQMLDMERAEMRKQLLNDARIARYETVTEIMIKLASQIGQSLQVLEALDGRIA